MQNLCAIIPSVAHVYSLLGSYKLSLHWYQIITLMQLLPANFWSDKGTQPHSSAV
jgi:hypothetical protein